MRKEWRPCRDYSPHNVAQSGQCYSIPIYQRLFEWEEEHIIILLEDLRRSYEKGEKDYYIGLLTSTYGNELVDGQQRFIMMMLLGAVLKTYYSGWEAFLYSQEGPRLYFSARPADNRILHHLISSPNGAQEAQGERSKMHEACTMIRNFVETKCAQYEKRVAFARYVYSHLRFFVTRLPQGYSSKHLNQHFERVNSTGKNLEQHEILKVRMLSILGDDANRYVCLWNKLADVDTIIIPKDDTERKRQAIEADGTTAISERFIQGLSDEDDERTLPIGEVPPSPQPPKPDGATHAEGRGILPFPHLLLQVLYRQLGQKPSVEDFFRTSDLLETFERYLLDKNGRIDQVRTFIDNLLKARLALDICFIRRSGDGYSLDMNRTEDDRMLRTLLMFQSMLYVSSDHSTHYRWFGWLMDMVEAHGIPEPERFYRDLKQRADALHPLPSLSSLTYGAMRYWFWRLDFLIWLHREKLFSQKDELKVVERYAFRRNRSIEHVAPRHPKRESTFQWCESDEDATLRDSFGNLVMISQGFNSALSNATYELKRAHVESHLNGSITTPIESLKLLALFAKYEKWDRLSIEEHGKEMYALLSEAYAAD